MIDVIQKLNLTFEAIFGQERVFLKPFLKEFLLLIDLDEDPAQCPYKKVELQKNAIVKKSTADKPLILCLKPFPSLY